MTCQVDPVTTDNALVYSSLNNATLAAGESLASATMAASSVLAAATLATAATAAKDAAFSSETLASESAATAVTKAAIVHNKAIEASIDRELAHKWSSEQEAVWISDGANVPGFSAYHWAKQAQYQNGLTTGTIAQYIADGVANYITYNAIGNSLLNTALGTRIEQIDIIDARTRADALITLQEIADRGTAITNEQTLRNAGDDQLAQDITTLSATTVANIAAAVLVESSARASEFDASAMVMSLLTAQLNDPVTGLEKTRADILTESTVRVTDQAAMASSINTLTASYTTANAAIQTEATTRASQDTALASIVTTLQTTVGGNTTAIETAQTVVDGINAKITVKIDANGYVSGYGLLSETNTVTGTPLSSFAIRADTFSIGAPAVPESAGQVAVAASKVYPLVVKTTKETIDGVVFQPGVYIDSAFITKISASQINTRGLTIKDDAGNVIFASGTALDWSNVGGTGKAADYATRNVFIGNWTTDTDYYSGDIVLDAMGYGWSCKLDHTSGATTTTGKIVPIYTVGGTNSNDNWSLYAVKGVDAISVILSNDSHVFPSTSQGVPNYIGSETTIRAYDGSTELIYDALGTDRGTWNVTAVGTNITPSTKVDSGDYVTYPDMSTGVDSNIDASKIVYTITGKSYNGTAFTIKTQQSFAKSKAGAPGTSSASAAAFAISNAGSILTKDASGTVQPSAGISLTTYSQNISSPSWQWYKDGGIISGAITGSYTVPTSDYTSTFAHTYKCIITGTVGALTSQTLEDSITIPLVVSGTSSPVVILSNESSNFPAPTTGFLNINYAGGGCDVTAYIGTTKLAYNITGPNTFSCTNETVSGCTVDAGEGASYTYSVVAPALTSDKAYNDVITTIRDGSGTALSTITKRINYSLSRAGYTGSNASGFNITTSAVSFIKGIDNIILPSSLSLATNYSNVTGTVTYRWAKSVNGGATYQNITTSGTSASYSITPASDYTPNTTTTYSTITYKCTLSGMINGVSGTLTDSITVPLLTNSQSASTVILSNENMTFQAATDGTVGSLAGGACNVTAYFGTTQLTLYPLYVVISYSGAVGTGYIYTTENDHGFSSVSNTATIIYNPTTTALLPGLADGTAYLVSYVSATAFKLSPLTGRTTFISPTAVVNTTIATRLYHPFTTDATNAFSAIVNNSITTSVNVPDGTISGNTFTVPAPTAMAADSAYIDVNIILTNAAGVPSRIDKRITYSKSKAGVKGTPGGAGDSVDIIFKRGANATTAPTITSPSALAAAVTAGWSSSVPAAGQFPLWSSTGFQTASTGNYTWQAPVRIEGANVAEVTIYTRSVPTTTPTGGTYAFGAASPLTTSAITATGALAGTWSGSVPSGTAAVYTSRAVVSAAAGYTSAVAISGWTPPVISLQDGAVGAQGPSVMVNIDAGSLNKSASFTSTDGTLDAANESIIFKAAVFGVTGPTYVWTFSGFAPSPVSSGGSTQTVTETQFGTSKSATVTCTVSGLYVDKVTIVRLEKSTAAAGATVGANLLNTYNVPALAPVASLTTTTGLYDTVYTSSTGNLVSGGSFAVTASSSVTDALATAIHGLAKGMPLLYACVGTAIPGLVTNTTYYVVNPTATTFSLALTAANAVAPVPVIIAIGAIPAGSTHSVTGNNWHYSGYSTVLYPSASGARVTFTRPDLTGGFMIGLTTDASVSPSYSTIDFAIFCSGSSYYVFQNGVNLGLFGTCVAGDDFAVIYNGAYLVSYYINGINFHTTVLPKAVVGSLSVDASFSTPNTTIGAIGSSAYGTAPLKTKSNNLVGNIHAGNVSTIISSAAIGAAQIGSINLVGNFNVASATEGARMTMDSQVIKIYDGELATPRVILGNLTA